MQMSGYAIARPQPNRASAVGLRLTRRGRLVASLLIGGTLGYGLLHGAAISQASAHIGHAPATAIVVVQPGESLWSIAERVAPNADPRVTITRIASLNGLRSSVLPAGKALIVPAPAS